MNGQQPLASAACIALIMRHEPAPSPTIEQAIASAEAAIQQLIKVPLMQHQVDALASLIADIGAGQFARSTLCELINIDALPTIAAKQFRRWNHSPRRIDEQRLFLGETA